MPDLSRLTTALADRYTIERELGQGGMATVYLAEDIKHDRKVAVKVLRPELAAVIGAERFLAEIKTTANLQHPHILPLFDSGEADSFLFYVMPYVEGISLRDRMTREKQLPINEAIRIASEVASALDYAHRHGVIHRDIKPENIMLHDGSALVADFGIALAASKAGTRMTETGMSLGTPQYMSPEQAMGERELDARSDVYALGCVTYEMLTGEPPFSGPTAQAIVAKVMTATPAPPTQLRSTVPLAVEQALLTALQKLPADRFGSAAEFAQALANPNATMARTAAHGAVAPRKRVWLISGAIAALALLAGLAIGRLRRDGGSVGPNEVVRASFILADSVVVRAIGNQRLAISPKGRRLVFVGPDGPGTQLWVREFDQATAHPLPDTKGGFDPFFSPDGESVGFFTASGGPTVLKVTQVNGGVARTVVQDSLATFGGADWGDDGRIYFTNAARGIARVASSGGAVTVVSRPDSSSGVQEHDYPDVIPGSRYAVVMLWKGSISSNRIGLINLNTGAVTDLAAGTYARYVAPGFLAIGSADGRILVARFDPRAGRLVGTPVLMLQGVQSESVNGTVQFAVSENTVVFERESGSSGELVWVDRSGHQTPLDTALKGVAGSVALSPDGTQIAMSRAERGDLQIWVKQLTTGALSRLSFDITTGDRPEWTPDGRSVAFLGMRNGRRTAWLRRADGSDSARPAVPGNMRLDEILFDPLGRYTLLRSLGTGAGTRHLFVLKKGADTLPRQLMASSFDNFAMALSPDGRWLAYVSNESGRPEVYVRPFPSVDSARYTISVGGGVEPLWRRDGTELYFRSQRGEMFTVAVTTGRHFEHGVPKLLFAAPGLAMQDYYRSYDVHPDGKRFLMVTSGGVDARELSVIFNWPVELRKLKGAGQ